MKHASAFILAAAATLAAPAIANAQWYGGLSLGQSRTDDELVRNRESTVVNGTVTGSSFDSTDTGYKVFGGYRFLSWLAVEANYTDLGESRLRTGVATTGPTETGSFTMDRKINGFGVDAVFSAPIGEHASVFGKVGAVRSELEAKATLAGSLVFTSGDPNDRSRTTKRDETVTRIGLGGEYMFTKNAGMRIEYERWLDVGKKFEIGGQGTTGEADTDFYSLSVIYRF